MKFFVALAMGTLLCSTTVSRRARAAEFRPPLRPGLREVVDALSEADLARVLPLLRENYVRAEKLTNEEAARSTVQGLLDRVAAGARILDAPSTATEEPSPFRSEVIDNRIAYVRFGSVSTANLGELDTALQSFAAKSGSALMLDLRATPPSSDFEQAAKICERFCPKGKVLFTIKRPTAEREQILTSKEQPRFSGILAVLVDHDTAGVGEVVAAVLRMHVKAMIIGQQTRGEAVEYSDVPLPSGKLLHVATAEIALPADVAIFPGGVKPDLAVDVSQETTDALLKVELEKGVSELVNETDRPRMNEAALVAGTNPELDALAASRSRGDRLKVPPLRDAALQRGLDFVTTISIYNTKSEAEK